MKAVLHAWKLMIHEHGKCEKSKKTRFLTIILTFENCDLRMNFVILPEAHCGPSACLMTSKIILKGFLDLLKLSETFAQRFMSFQTDFNETEILNNFLYTTS